MAEESIIIIGAGMGGLAAGVYGQRNGFPTQIFEMHTLPGGQCTAWKRRGYTFDVCIHHLFGCDPSSRIYDLWHELGAMPRELVPTQECASVVSPEGKLFRDYYDLQTLQQHLEDLSPRDSKVIEEYVRAIRAMIGRDHMGAMMMGMPNKKGNILASAFGRGWEMTLPDLSNFYMVGQWATSAGSLFSNALSGRTAVKTLCKQLDRKFVA